VGKRKKARNKDIEIEKDKSAVSFSFFIYVITLGSGLFGSAVLTKPEHRGHTALDALMMLTYVDTQLEELTAYE